MNKKQVKCLTENDDKLQWWAGSVLFAEICELVETQKNGYDIEIVYKIIVSKVEEFPRLVIQRQIERSELAAGVEKSVFDRLTALEEKVFGAQGEQGVIRGVVVKEAA